jgi:hypothetical protein
MESEWHWNFVHPVSKELPFNIHSLSSFQSIPTQDELDGKWKEIKWRVYEFRPSSFQENTIAIQYHFNIHSLSSSQSIPNVIPHIIPHIAIHSPAIQGPLSKHSNPINHSNNNKNEETRNEQHELNPTLKNTLTSNNININKEQH